MAKEELKMTIGAEINSDDLLQQLTEVFKQATGILESGISNATPSSGSGSNDSKESSGSGMLSGLKKIFGSLKSIGGVIGKIGLVVAIAAAFMDTLRTVFKIISMGVKIIAELFRPVSDMLMILLMPILSILRPILQVVRTLMMPFKQAAIQGSAAANMLISGGMKEILDGNTEVGNEMMGAGFKGALSSANLMFSGFIEMIGTPLANLFGKGEKWAGMMDTWQDSALRGINTVILSSDFVNDLGEGIKDIDPTLLSLTFHSIRESIDLVGDGLEGGFKIENFQTDLAAIRTDFGVLLDGLIEDIETKGNEVGDISEFSDSSKGVLSTGLSSQIEEENRDKTGIFGLAVKSWWAGEKAVISSIFDGEDGVGVFDFSARKKLGEEAFTEEFNRIVTNNKEIQAAQVGLFTEFAGTLSTEEMSFYSSRYDSAVLYMGKEGKLKTAFDGGLTAMNSSADTFKTNMGTVGDSVKKIAEEAAKYAKEAARSASKAKSILNSVRGS